MPRHVIVDGSNLATEGRAMPSLKQLIDAVQAFIEEHPDDLITVVVDATFGHRIDPREVAEFESAIEHNELVAPPAGAVGRGDAFVLAIANKVDGTILSNDSFQEFHAEHTWLFDDGRLVGGKPVPHIGWVFVARVPVRGPISRKVQREARRGPRESTPVSGVRGRSGRVAVEPIAVIGSKEASQPMPVPKAPPPNVRRAAAAVEPADQRTDAPAAPGRANRRSGRSERVAVDAPTPIATAAATPSRSSMVNEFMPFLTFIENHPVGSSVDVLVESYSSHGAYGRVGDARVYLPLRNISDPAPRSARDAVALAETVSLVVAAFHPARRGIDVVMPSMASAVVPVAETVPAKPARSRSTKKADAVPVADGPSANDVATSPQARARRRGRDSAAVGETSVVEPTRPAAEASSIAADPTPAEPAPSGRGRRAAAPSKPTAQATPAGRRGARSATPPPVTDTSAATPVEAVDGGSPSTETAARKRSTRPSKGHQPTETIDALSPSAVSAVKAAVEKRPQARSRAVPRGSEEPSATDHPIAVAPAKSVAKSANRVQSAKTPVADTPAEPSKSAPRRASAPQRSATSPDTVTAARAGLEEAAPAASADARGATRKQAEPKPKTSKKAASPAKMPPAKTSPAKVSKSTSKPSDVSASASESPKSAKPPRPPKSTSAAAKVAPAGAPKSPSPTSRAAKPTAPTPADAGRAPGSKAGGSRTASRKAAPTDGALPAGGSPQATDAPPKKSRSRKV